MRSTSSGPIILSVPARAENVQLLRSVAGAAAARHDLTFDAIDDLRIAVDEACAQLLRAGGTRLTLQVRAAEHGIEALVSIDAHDPAWPPEGIEHSLAWQVLKGLSDEVGAELGAGGPVIRIAKRGVEATQP
ncbi:MAG TPA: ATP-binding protein [Actinomycetota bacterium]|nr:ATP-binding protein [Actinomycetota bacterium]